jgi:hypothetical protein
MNMPGFTAEASLAKVGQRYVLSTRTQTNAGDVMPQLYSVGNTGSSHGPMGSGGICGCFDGYDGSSFCGCYKLRI